MTTTTVEAPAGPRPLLAYLLLHQHGDAATLAGAVGRSGEQLQRALSRLARRGLIEQRDGRVELAPRYRAAVADYAEGAITLRELVAAGR